MINLRAYFGLLSTLLLVCQSNAMPTTFQKLSCAKEKLVQEMGAQGLSLDESSLDLKQSYSPVNALYFGADLASMLSGRGVNGSDVEYVTFTAHSNDQNIKGWMYMLSSINLSGQAVHDCTVGSADSLSSISLGKVILEQKD